MEADHFQPPKSATATLAFTATVSDPVIELQPSSTPPCTDGLTFVEDISIPDGTIVFPGDHLDKRWKVKNTGSCNWNAGYYLALIAGPAMEAAPQQALYPSLSGTDVAIRMIFTAPEDVGIYRSAWQAYNVLQQPFGDPIYIEIEVVVGGSSDDEQIINQ